MTHPSPTSHAPCLRGEPLTRQDYIRLAAQVRGELDRADLNGRARRLAEFVVKATLMRGRTRVVIPNRAQLCALLGIGQTHVAEVLAALSSARIVVFTEIADGWELLLLADAAGWQVEWHYAREAMGRYLDQLDQAPGQAQGELLEPEPSLRRSLAEVSAESAMGAGGRQRAESRSDVRMVPGGGSALPKMVSEGRAPLSFKNLQTESALSFESLKLKAGSDREAEAMEGLQRVLGGPVWERDGGKWRNRWRQDREKVRRVFGDMLADLAHGKKFDRPGGRAETLWQMFN